MNARRGESDIFASSLLWSFTVLFLKSHVTVITQNITQKQAELTLVFTIACGPKAENLLGHKIQIQGLDNKNCSHTLAVAFTIWEVFHTLAKRQSIATTTADLLPIDM